MEKPIFLPNLVSRNKLLEREKTLEWTRTARPNQIAPHGEHPLPEMRRDDWLIWYIRAGRGWGKTLAGAQWIKQVAHKKARIAIVAPTFDMGRDICIEGETGLKSLIPDLHWNRSMGEMTFPSGARGKLFSAEEPDRLRGPNNYYAWCDEMSSWRYQKETWDMLMFTLRKGASQVAITTTPRPSPLAKDIQARANTIVTWGSTYENTVNLSAAYISNIVKPYEGTALGRQELEAQDIEDIAGALWTRDVIESSRLRAAPDLVRIVISLDPAVSTGETSAETGIIAAGIDREGHAYILEDASLRGTPHQWATQAVTCFQRHGADRLIAEANNGGDMVAHTLRTVESSLPVTLVHASRGKYIRAEPISALYERGLVHHVGTFPLLEYQMCAWLPGHPSPDRLDALVWALTELMLNTSTVTQGYTANPFYGD